MNSTSKPDTQLVARDVQWRALIDAARSHFFSIELEKAIASGDPLMVAKHVPTTHPLHRNLIQFAEQAPVSTPNPTVH